MKRSGGSNQSHDINADTRAPLVRLIVALSLPLIVQDFPVPWKGWVLAQLTESETMRLSRERLSYRIRTSDYRLRYGPVWLKRFAQSGIENWIQYRFWVLVVFKIVLSSALVSLPVLIFGIYRFYLPDPAPYLEAQERRQPSRYETDLEPGVANLFPYFVAESEQDKTQKLIAGWPASSSAQSVSVLPLKNSAAVLQPQSRLSNSSSSMALVRASAAASESAPYAARPAYLVDESRPLVFENRENFSNRNSRSEFSAEVLGGNSIGGHFIVYTTQKRRVRCRFELRDEDQNLLFSVEKFAMSALSRSGLQDSFVWRPDITLSAAANLWQSYRFRMDELPRKLFFSVRQAISEEDAAAGASGAARPNPAQGKELSDRSDCFVAVSDPHYQKQTLKARQVHGVMLVVIDGLAGQRWSRKNLMPNLQELAAHGHSYTRYFSPSSDTAGAVSAILNQETAAGAKSVFESARLLGYSTALFGDSADLYFDSKSPPTRQSLPDFVIGNSSDKYGGLAASIQAREWLDTFGSNPFFIVVRLSDIKGRIIPPWKYLDARRFVSAPFGYEGRLTRYDAMLSYMDDNLSIVVDALRAGVTRNGGQGVLVVTGSTGIQTSEFGHRDSASAGGVIRGASFDVGGDLLPDALHVPLVHVSFDGANRDNAPAGATLGQAASVGNFATHRELNEYFQMILREDRPSHIPARRSPVVITEPRGVALLGSSDESHVSFWGKGMLQSSGRLFRRHFPFEVMNSFESTGFGVSLTYNPETGALLEKPRYALAKGDLDARDFLTYAFLAREPSFVFSSATGDGVKRLKIEPMARASVADPRSGQELQSGLSIARVIAGKPQVPAADSAFSNDGGSISLELTDNAKSQQTSSTFIANGVFGGAASLTVDAVDLTICGARMQTPSFSLTRIEILELRRAPPLCMFLSRLNDLGSSGGPAANATIMGYGWP
jgi:hypothetical protein